LQKKAIKEIQFDLIIMQIQNAQPQWVQNFTNMGGPTLLFSHLIKDNYRYQNSFKLFLFFLVGIHFGYL